jgi:hypothetical protein
MRLTVDGVPLDGDRGKKLFVARMSIAASGGRSIWRNAR